MTRIDRSAAKIDRMNPEPTRPNVMPLIVVAMVIGVALFVAGVITGLMLGRSSATPSTAAAPTTAPVARRAPPAPPIVSGERSTRRDPLPRIAPTGNTSNLDSGIRQREDGMVFVVAGRGSLNVFPQSDQPFAFSLRPAPGPRSPDTQVSLALVNGDAPQRFSLTLEQQDRLKQIGPLPQPARDAREEIIALFEDFLIADETARPAAEKALLDAVRQEGEARAPVVDQWHVERAEVLSEEQRAIVLPNNP